MRILIVEDNSTYGHLVAQRLAQAGFDSDEVTSASAARRALLSVRYAAILLDLGLPDDDGIVLLRQIRSAGHTMPVMIVTARHGLEHRLQGLREGADDYLAKPFSMEELAKAWRPYIETCIEAWGADRCMFESNFPVDKGMCSYPVLWNALKRLASGASAAEKTALFSGTAMRVYKLDKLPEALKVTL